MISKFKITDVDDMIFGNTGTVPSDRQSIEKKIIDCFSWRSNDCVHHLSAVFLYIFPETSSKNVYYIPNIK